MGIISVYALIHNAIGKQSKHQIMYLVLLCGYCADIVYLLIPDNFGIISDSAKCCYDRFVTVLFKNAVIIMQYLRFTNYLLLNCDSQLISIFEFQAHKS